MSSQVKQNMSPNNEGITALIASLPASRRRPLTIVTPSVSEKKKKTSSSSKKERSPSPIRSKKEEVEEETSSMKEKLLSPIRSKNEKISLSTKIPSKKERSLSPSKSVEEISLPTTSRARRGVSPSKNEEEEISLPTTSRARRAVSPKKERSLSPVKKPEIVEDIVSPSTLEEAKITPPQLSIPTHILKNKDGIVYIIVRVISSLPLQNIINFFEDLAIVSPGEETSSINTDGLPVVGCARIEHHRTRPETDKYYVDDWYQYSETNYSIISIHPLAADLLRQTAYWITYKSRSGAHGLAIQDYVIREGNYPLEDCEAVLYCSFKDIKLIPFEESVKQMHLKMINMVEAGFLKEKEYEIHVPQISRDGTGMYRSFCIITFAPAVDIKERAKIKVSLDQTKFRGAFEEDVEKYIQYMCRVSWAKKKIMPSIRKNKYQSRNENKVFQPYNENRTIRNENRTIRNENRTFQSRNENRTFQSRNENKTFQSRNENKTFQSRNENKTFQSRNENKPIRTENKTFQSRNENKPIRTENKTFQSRNENRTNRTENKPTRTENVTNIEVKKSKRPTKNEALTSKPFILEEVME